MLVSEEVAGSITGEMKKFPYSIPEYKVLEGKTILITNEGEFQLKVFGKHNLMNLEGARLVCNQLNISNLDFYNAISSVSGASNRLELIAQKAGFNAYRDFAHAPSKLTATISAVKEQFPKRRLVSCFELHTFSSLNKDFLNLVIYFQEINSFSKFSEVDCSFIIQNRFNLVLVY